MVKFYSIANGQCFMNCRYNRQVIKNSNALTTFFITIFYKIQPNYNLQHNNNTAILPLFVRYVKKKAVSDIFWQEQLFNFSYYSAENKERVGVGTCHLSAKLMVSGDSIQSYFTKTRLTLIGIILEVIVSNHCKFNNFITSDFFNSFF